MKKALLLVFILLLSFSLFGCLKEGKENPPGKEGQPQEKPQQTGKLAEEAVTSLVENFGSKLQAVSLQGPRDIVEKSIEENYGPFISPPLLAQWQKEPLNAPGRLTSSPWPDRIEILTIEKLAEDGYKVKGEIIEITSAEQEKGGIAAKRPITLLLKKVENNWLIDTVTLGPDGDNNKIVYKNNQYGFNFSLPSSWEGYEIIAEKWEGRAVGDSQGDKIVETGPLLAIRHPQWTTQNRRQDIPIMVFTLKQWNSLQEEEFHIGAAPIGPSELGRNSKYVFALPARYNYAFPTGFEEVEKILASNALQPNEEIVGDKQ